MNALWSEFVDPEGRAMIIDRKPAILQAFFEPYRESLSRPQFSHLWSLLLAWAVNVQPSVVWHLATRLPEGVHRTSHGRFLTQAPWDPAGLLNDTVGRALRRMKPRRGEAIYLILDDHRIAQRG